MKTTIINASELNIVNVLSNNLKKGVSITCVTDSEPNMLKGTKRNPNPFLGRVRKVARYGGYSVGTDYVKSCQNATERSGSTETFVAKESWHIRYNDFFVTNKAGDKFYLQLQKSAKQSTKKEETYFLDGRIATNAEIKKIKAWLPKKSHQQSSSQAESGITAENERTYFNVAVANLSCIKQGSFAMLFDDEEHKTERTAVAVATI